ncbi:hypothetical protein [Sphaerisporangium rhizosphaerae]|uniref:Uncharacterized protein n=1 Tax=Sphaerisporangium rhizosphaerae TaxID=2269375 RepID=A0ABW2P382_9ACTN
MYRPVQGLSWGLAGVTTAVVLYVLAVPLVVTLTLSLYTLVILMLWLPIAWLVIGVLGVAVSTVVLVRTPSPAALSWLSFCCGWALCPAVYLLVLLSRS